MQFTAVYTSEHERVVLPSVAGMEQVVDNVPSSFPAPAPRPVLNTTPQEQPSNGAMAGAGVTASGDHALPAASVSSNGEASNGLTTPALDTSAVTTTEISEAAAVPSTTPSIVSGTSTELVTKAAPEAGGVTTPDAAKPSENDVPAPVAGENKLGTEQPRRKRTRRGGWDTPAVVVPTVPVLPVNPLQVTLEYLGQPTVYFCVSSLTEAQTVLSFEVIKFEYPWTFSTWSSRTSYDLDQ